MATAGFSTVLLIATLMSEGEMAMDNVPPGLPGKECDRMGGKYKYPENQEFRASVMNAVKRMRTATKRNQSFYGCNLEFWSRLYLYSPKVYKAMEPAKIWVAGRAGYQYEIPDAETAIGSIFEKQWKSIVSNSSVLTRIGCFLEQKGTWYNVACVARVAKRRIKKKAE